MAQRPPDQNPFKRGRQRYIDCAREFRHFLDCYEKVFKEFVEEDVAFGQLHRFLGAVVSQDYLPSKSGTIVVNGPPPTLQFEFGPAALGLGRRGPNGEIATEHGASLVYSFGPNGTVAVMLYPAKSELGSAIESSILLRIGFYSCAGLMDGFRRDLLDWVCYAHATAMDGNPTVREKMRVRWIRFKQPKYLEGKYQHALLPQSVRGITNVVAKLIVGLVLGAGFKVIAPGIIGFIMGMFLG